MQRTEIAKWSIITAGFALAFAAGLGALAQGRGVSAAAEAIARNPGAAGDIRGVAHPGPGSDRVARHLRPADLADPVLPVPVRQQAGLGRRPGGASCRSITRRRGPWRSHRIDSLPASVLAIRRDVRGSSAARDRPPPAPDVGLLGHELLHRQERVPRDRPAGVQRRCACRSRPLIFLAVIVGVRAPRAWRRRGAGGTAPGSVFYTPAPMTPRDWWAAGAARRRRPLLLPGTCFMAGLARTSVANSSLMLGATPVLVALISALLGPGSRSARCTGSAPPSR